MRRTRLVVAGVVAALAVSAAVVVLSQDRSTTIKRITGASDNAPGVAWTVDASLSGLDGATFADPRLGSIYTYGPGAIGIDGTLFTLAVVEADLTASDAELMAIDSTTGEVRWTASARNIDSCAEEPLQGQLICHMPSYGGEPGLITFDLSTGESHRYDSAPDGLAITVANDRVYTVGGGLEDGDVSLYRGTLDDYDADWSVPLQASGSYEDQYVDKLVVDADTGHFDVGGSFSTFDAETGQKIWATDILDDCLSAVSRSPGDVSVGVRTDCESYDSIGSAAFSRSGDVIVESPSIVTQSPSTDEPTDLAVPIVLGDSAYDRSTGEKRWSNDQLITDQAADEYSEARSYGALTAVIGDIGLLNVDQNIVALDMLTGQQKWESTSFSLLGNDDGVGIAMEDRNLVAVDLRSGVKLWTAPFANLTGQESEYFSTYIGGREDKFTLQSGSTMVGVAPLPS